MSQEFSSQKTFVFAILAQYGPDGNLVDYALQSQNEGIRDEIVFTMMHNWLRMEEEKYYARFTGEQQK